MIRSEWVISSSWVLKRDAEKHIDWWCLRNPDSRGLHRWWGRRWDSDDPIREGSAFSVQEGVRQMIEARSIVNLGN